MKAAVFKEKNLLVVEDVPDPKPVDCLPVEWVGREVELRSCYAHLNHEWLISLALMAEKKIVTKPMITQAIGLKEIQAAFQDLLRPDTQQIQVVVQCNF